MNITFPSLVTGTLDTVALLQIQFSAPVVKQTLVYVDTTGPLAPQDIRGRDEGGAYVVEPGVQALHVPLEVTAEGAGEAQVTVRWSDGSGAERSETRAITITGPAAGAGKGSGGAGKMALVGLLAGGLAAGALFWQPWAKSEMPDVIQLTVAEAEARLEKASVKYTIEHVPVTTPAEEGYVQATMPAARAEVSDRAVLKVGRYEVELRNFQGESESAARAALEQMNLFASVRLEDVSDEADVGVVIQQSPSSGKAVRPHSEVVLTVGRRAEPLAPAGPTPEEIMGDPTDPVIADAGTDATPTDPGTAIEPGPGVGVGEEPAVTATGPDMTGTEGTTPEAALPDSTSPDSTSPAAAGPTEIDPSGSAETSTGPNGTLDPGASETARSGALPPAGEVPDATPPNPDTTSPDMSAPSETHPDSVAPPLEGPDAATGTTPSSEGTIPDSSARDDGSRVNPTEPRTVPAEGETGTPENPTATPGTSGNGVDYDPWPPHGDRTPEATTEPKAPGSTATGPDSATGTPDGTPPTTVTPESRPGPDRIPAAGPDSTATPPGPTSTTPTPDTAGTTPPGPGDTSGHAHRRGQRRTSQCRSWQRPRRRRHQP